jgi:hypothetical protein
MKYDFAHPKIHRGYVQFPIKGETLFDCFCRLANRYRVSFIRSQMVITSPKFMAKVFNRISYLEIRQNGKSTILHNEMEVLNFINNIR